MPATRLGIVAYPIHLPFRSEVVDILLLTHMLMFLEGKQKMKVAIRHAIQLTKLIVVLSYKKNLYLGYTTEELKSMLSKHLMLLKRGVVS